MDEGTFKNKVFRLFEFGVLKGVSDELEKTFIRVETISCLSKLIHEGKFKDAVETAKQKSVSRKRKEITMLEAQIAAQQEQLKKIKTEVSVKLSSMLCDEEDVLFTELPCKDVATESSETLNLKVSATTTNENIVETEDKGSA